MCFYKACNCAIRMYVIHWSYVWQGPYAAAFAELIRVLASSSVGWAAIAPGFEHVKPPQAAANSTAERSLLPSCWNAERPPAYIRQDMINVLPLTCHSRATDNATDTQQSKKYCVFKPIHSCTAVACDDR